MFVFIRQKGPGGKLITNLFAEEGPLAGKMFRLKEQKVNVGKASDNQIILALPQIDDYQAEIDLTGPEPYLRELSSYVATWVNGQRVSQTTLKHGDRIRFGLDPNDQTNPGQVLLARQPVVPLVDDVRTVLGTRGANSNVAPAPTRPSQPKTAAELQQRQFEVLLAVSKALSRPEHLESKVDRVLELLFDTMQIDRAALLVLNDLPSTTERFAWSSYRDKHGPTPSMDLSSTIINRVIEEGVAVLTQDAQNEDWLDGARSVLGQEIRTCICTPLKTSSGLLGVLYADSTRPSSQPFRREDMEFFTAFSNQAAVAVENARLLRVALEKERIEQDLRVARNIQRMLFPNDLPELPGYELAGDSFSMEQVGGDYFDYMRLGERHLALVVGDVSGHGVSSSLVMTMTRSILRGSLLPNISPAQLLQRVNELVSEDMLPRMFVTMLLVVVDLQTGEFSLSSAGHPPLLQYHAHAQQVQSFQLKSPPLGMSRWARLKPRYKDLQGRLTPGDVLFLYTDGITEAADKEGNQFEERLEEAFLHCVGYPAKDIVQYIFRMTQQFCQDQSIADDYTAIALKRA